MSHPFVGPPRKRPACRRGGYFLQVKTVVRLFLNGHAHVVLFVAAGYTWMRETARGLLLKERKVVRFLERHRKTSRVEAAVLHRFVTRKSSV